MKLSVIQKNLKDSLTLCSHFISPKAQLPILGNIKLKTTSSKLILSSTNLETSVSTSIGAKVEKQGEITVPGRILTEIVSNLSLGNVNLEVKKESMVIECGSFKSTVSGMNTSDFPVVPTNLAKKNVVKFGREDFVKALQKSQFAVSLDETRPVLTGVLFLFKGNNLYQVATDGFRLSQVKIALGLKTDIKNLIIPRAILSEISKSEGGDEILFSYNKKDSQVLFGVGDSVFSSRVIEGEFPDFEKIIPKTSTFKLTVDKHELEQAVKLASVFARDSGNIIRLKVIGDRLQVKSESSNSGNQETEVEVKIETEDPPAGGKVDLEIAYNYRFLEEFIKASEGDSIEIELTTPDKPGKFLDPTNPNFLHLIMPIKVQG